MSRRKRKTTKRRKRRNPSPRKAARKARAYAGATLAGINIKRSIINGLPLLLGALAGKWTAKKFAPGGGEMDDWTWQNYLLALGGGFGAAFIMSALSKQRYTIGQKVFEGALLLVGYKLFTQELAPKNSTLSEWFSGYGQLPEYEEIGQIWQGDEGDYVTGADGLYRPIDESHRLPSAAGFGAEIVPATPSMGGYYGDEVVPASPTMGYMGQDVEMTPPASVISNEFEKAYG